MSATSTTSYEHLVDIATIGHIDHGKSTLAAALAKHRPQASGLESSPPAGTGGIMIESAQVTCDSSGRRYRHVDCDSHYDHIKGLIAGNSGLHAALLVDGAEPSTRGHIELCRAVGIEHIVVFLNKVDLVDEKDLKDLVGLEVAELLSSYGYPEDTPIIAGSARMALLDNKNSLGAGAIEELIKPLDS